MTRAILALCCSAGAAAGLASPSAAQIVNPWSVEGRIGAAIPTGDISDNDETAGLAVGADLMYAFARSASVYAGGSWYRFNCDGDACVGDRTGRGVDAGVKVGFAQEGSSALPWIRGGVILHQTEIEDSDSDWAPGFEVGAGVDLALSPRFSLVPGFRLYGYEADFADEENDATMRFFVVDLGGHIHF